jgi:hypothetical protein
MSSAGLPRYPSKLISVIQLSMGIIVNTCFEPPSDTRMANPSLHLGVLFLWYYYLSSHLVQWNRWFIWCINLVTLSSIPFEPHFCILLLYPNTYTYISTCITYVLQPPKSGPNLHDWTDARTLGQLARAPSGKATPLFIPPNSPTLRRQSQATVMQSGGGVDCSLLGVMMVKWGGFESWRP